MVFQREKTSRRRGPDIRDFCLWWAAWSFEIGHHLRFETLPFYHHRSAPPASHFTPPQSVPNTTNLQAFRFRIEMSRRSHRSETEKERKKQAEKKKRERERQEEKRKAKKGGEHHRE